MTDLRREAIDRQCQIRLDGCEGSPCCLCHFRIIGQSGMGYKNFDEIGAWGCNSCHIKVDRTMRGDLQTQFDFAMGVFRTQHILIKEGLLNGEQ